MDASALPRERLEILACGKSTAIKSTLLTIRLETNATLRASRFSFANDQGGPWKPAEPMKGHWTLSTIETAR
jgi:hypothetical protein